MAKTAERYVGGGVLRKEDPELVTGQARFIDDLTLPGMVWMAVVRSPFAHARIKSVDVSKALEMPGVVGAWSGEDLASEWAAPLLCAWPATEDIKMSEHWPVTKDKARHLGEAVAVVVAESRALAKDAAEVVEVDYDPLPAVTDVEAAIKDDAPIVHEQFGTNNSFTWAHSVGDADAVFVQAPVAIKKRYWHPRLIPNAMEARGVLVQHIPASGEFTIWSATQIPHVAKFGLSGTCGIPESKLRMIAPDVGGGFGSKLNIYAEEAICLALARRLQRPVKWIEERSENYLATIHGRGVLQDIELAATEEGKLLAVRVKMLCDMGAYFQLLTPGIPMLGAWLYSGCYTADAYSFQYTGVFTTQTPTDAYRGAGRPEAAYAIERAMDALARKVGKDPVEIRRLNFMPPFTEPTTQAGGLQFDSGNYQETLDRALALAGYEDLRAEQRARRERGDTRQLGIGFSTYIELCGWAPSQVTGAIRYAGGGWDAAVVRVLPSGKVEAVTGTSPHGQGHVTAWSQIVADDLGVPFEDVEVLHGDTQVAPLGLDTYGSRSAPVGAVAVHLACQRLVEKARRIAAHELEVAEEDLEFGAGSFTVKGAPDKARTIQEIAFHAWQAHNLPADVEPNLEASYVFDPPNLTFPAGAHICVVEVDTQTGQTDIVKYVAVDDCGKAINPMLVDGQIQGGIAQGIAEALYEEAVYDENGTLLTSSMASYAVPSATEIPSFILDRIETPSTTNPLGVKGIGEAGTNASPPAVINAVVDALSHLGVTDIQMPATPERVWRAIHRRAEEPPEPEAAGPGGGVGSAERAEGEEAGR
jgi:aerobic carbon-monoxide dehydrogenase large subunit